MWDTVTKTISVHQGKGKRCVCNSIHTLTYGSHDKKCGTLLQEKEEMP